MFPDNVPFRPIWFDVTASSYQPGAAIAPNVSNPGVIATVGGQLRFKDPVDADIVTNSRVTNKGRTRLFYPKSSSRYLANTAKEVKTAEIAAICIGKASREDGYLRGIGRMLIKVGLEQMPAKCPTNLGEDITAKRSPSRASTSSSSIVDINIPMTSSECTCLQYV